MNPNKFAFIIVANNDLFLEECFHYLSLLKVPEGFETELLTIREAKSMLSGMEEGRDATDAKYKIYMHQDVFIINPFFLYDILTIFQSDPQIGLIGTVGSIQIPSDGIMWSSKRIGNIYDDYYKNTSHHPKPYALTDGLYDVNSIDGLMMISSCDIPFRTDLFDGWDFYDVSTSLEYQRRRYRVVVPKQLFPWVIHDDGRILSMWNYDKYRHIALEEYTDFF